MKKIGLFSLFVFIAMICGVCPDSFAAEEKPLFWIGGYADYNRNIHSADFIELPGCPGCCTGYKSGSGNGFSIGALFEYPLSDKFMLGARAGYSVLNAKLKKDDVIGNVEVRKTTPPYDTEKIADASSEHTIDAKIGQIDIEPYLGYNIYEGLNGYLGLNLGFGGKGTFDQAEKLTAPVGVVFKETGTTTRNAISGRDIPDLKSFRFGVVLGLGYMLPISKTAFLVPEVRYNLGLTDVSSVSWKASALQLGAHAKFPIFPAKEIPVIRETKYERDTIVTASLDVKQPEVRLVSRNERLEAEERDGSRVETTIISEKYEKKVPKTAKLEADLQIVGIASDGTRQDNPTIIIEETETEETFPLLPYIFFKAGASDLASSGVRSITPEDAEKFSENGLPWETMDIYADLLNIVGYRMKKAPKSEITITGTNSNNGAEAVNMALSEKRAQAVKKYLVDAWGISEKRIITKKQNLPDKPANISIADGIEENQRAEISSRDLSLLKPVSLSDIRRSANPPVVMLSPSANSEAGVRSWNIDVKQAGTRLRNFKGNTELVPQSWEVAAEPVPSLESPVDINLAVADNSGNTKNIAKELKIQQKTIKKKKELYKDNWKVEKFSLILFDYDKAEITQKHIPVLEDIKSRIKPDSKVTISGYADRTGEKQYNKDLALRRCLEVQKVLKVPEKNLLIVPVGNDELLFGNETPQGRNYCRTVRIIIETPVNK